MLITSTEFSLVSPPTRGGLMLREVEAADAEF